jgi:WD40 repeat protein
VWETYSGKEVAKLGHQDVTAVEFNSVGSRIVTGSEDGTARVWETGSGKEVARLTHQAGVTAVSFSPDRPLLWTASGDVVRYNYLAPQDLIEQVCERLTRNLTQNEWSKYLATETYQRTCLNLPEPVHREF